MSRRYIFLSLLLPLLVATGSLAQSIDISGTWAAKTTSTLGTSRQSLTFKPNAGGFTGEMITSQGKKEIIKDGKVNGSDIEFHAVRRRATGETVLVLYKGKVNGNQIAGTFVGWSGRTVHWAATRR